MEQAKMAEGPDLISNLPNGINEAILSRLPLQEAAATSVLSWRWRYLWKWIEILEIDPRTLTRKCREHNLIAPPDPFQFLKPPKVVNSKIVRRDLHRSTKLIGSIIENHFGNIKYCQIIHFGHNMRSGQLNQWIMDLKLKKIEELSLRIEEVYFLPKLGFIDESLFSLPEGIFRSSTLHTLQLTNYASIACVDPFVGSNNLTTLRLDSIQVISDEILKKIFCSCPSLEEFVLRRSSGFTHLSICSGKLKILELVELSLDVLEIEALELKKLVLDTMKCDRRKMMIVAPYVVALRVTHEASEPRLFIPAGWEEKTLDSRDLIEDSIGLGCRPNDVQPFMTLQKLSICWNLNNVGDGHLLKLALQEYPGLVTLEISNQVKIYANNGNRSQNLTSHEIQDPWGEKEKIFSVENMLKAVTITGFRGDQQACAFVKYLITKARNFARLTIQCYDYCTTHQVEATSRLMSLPKASPSLSIVLKPGDECSASYL